jgi:DNA gyrase inhibitor GyrI
MISRLEKILMSAAIGTLAGLFGAGCGAVRGGYNSAPYRVVQESGKFEVRDYPALTVVETRMTSTNGSQDNGSFMRLFRFISGENEAQRKIAMTTPVFMSAADTNATMAFVMPVDLKAKETPAPKDKQLEVREVEAGRFAVLRFSGSQSPEHEAKSLAQLRAWMKAEGLTELSPPVYGYFDPPWTPAFLRRSEVMVRVARADS